MEFNNLLGYALWCKIGKNMENRAKLSDAFIWRFKAIYGLMIVLVCVWVTAPEKIEIWGSCNNVAKINLR